MAIPAGFAGIGLTFSFEMTTFLKHFVRMYASTEAAMNSVERVSYYINELDQEPPKTSADPPPSDWPQKGELIVDNLSMRYRKGLPEVLRNIKFSVQPGERVGIVGRMAVESPRWQCHCFGFANSQDWSSWMG